MTQPEVTDRWLTTGVVVITGATAGVGRAAAWSFARVGAKVALIARDPDSLAALANELRGTATAVMFVAADVADAQALDAAAIEVERVLGPIAIWVNNAMLTVFSPVRELSATEFKRVTEVTYLGAVYGSMAALRRMEPRDSGHIINVGSALGYRGLPLQSAYCGAKHALRGFTSTLRSELQHDKSGIAVSMVVLPAMNTPQFDWARTHMLHQPRPMGTIYQPETAASAVLRAARTRAREYWVGAPTLLTILGNMVAPALLDRYLARVAYKGQQTKQAVLPDRTDNLLEPVGPLHRTHGVFESQAHSTATVVSGSVARVGALLAVATVFLILGALIS